MTLPLPDITIDPEFEQLIPPLTSDENQQLIANVERDGFRDAVVVWLGHGILVDGHNRMRIWRDVYGSDEDRSPEVVERAFKDRDDVKLWIIRNQLGRRNVTDAVRVELALQLKPILQAKAKENRELSGQQHGRGKVSVTLPEPIQPIDTRKEIAAAAGVSEKTVDKVEKVLASNDAELKSAMRSGEVSINAAAEAVKTAQETGQKPMEVVAAKKQSPPQETRPWNIMDDVAKLSDVVRRLEDNWKHESDRAVIRHWFSQTAREI